MRNIRLSELIAPHYYAVHQDIREHGHTHYWLDGGRGAVKSSFVSLEIPLILKRNPQANALILRKVAGTIKDSVYNQILWAIDMLGLQEEFRATRSPLEITYLPTGQKIYFRGADDPVKIKSIKPKQGYIAIAWYEELDQFGGPEEIRSINQSIMRGGELFWLFYSYNPPKSKDNWVNVEKFQTRSDRLDWHSTYLDVPKEWLGEQFLLEAEELKRKKPQAYEHEYMGIATGTGGAVFENIMERPITEEEILTLGNFYYGIDFGFAVDPFVFGIQSYDKARKTLYILDEIYEPKMSNSRAAERIKEKGVLSKLITADSAEPKSIAALREYGLNVKGAAKGPDSVDFGIRWLQDLDAIVIDKARTPNAYREFTCYEYDMDRAGNYISAYPDKNNHFIDQCRYALESVMERRKARIVQNNYLRR